MNALTARAVKAGWSGVDHQPLLFWLVCNQSSPWSMASWTSLRKEIEPWLENRVERTVIFAWLVMEEG